MDRRTCLKTNDTSFLTLKLTDGCKTDSLHSRQHSRCPEATTKRFKKMFLCVFMKSQLQPKFQRNRIKVYRNIHGRMYYRHASKATWPLFNNKTPKGSQNEFCL